MSWDKDSTHSNREQHTRQGRRVALVVGVNHAPESELSRLQFAESDAQAVAVELTQHVCGFELHCLPLLGQHATSRSVQEALLSLSGTLGENDLLLFFFSGHGRPVWIEADRKDIYLVTSDYNETYIKLDENFYLSLRWLQDKVLRRTDVGQVLLLLDCCYPAIGEVARDVYLEELKTRIEYYLHVQNASSPSGAAEARWSLTASSPTEEAREKDGRGLFTSALLEALNGKAVDDEGYVTIDTLSSYIHQQISPMQKPGRYGFGHPRRPLWLAHHPQLARAKIEAERKRLHEEELDAVARRTARAAQQAIITDPDYFCTKQPVLWGLSKAKKCPISWE